MTPSDLIKSGVAYAQDVASGEVVACKKVRQACERFLRMYSEEDSLYEFVPRFPEHVFKFASNIKNIKGQRAGHVMKLEPWQCFVIICIYGFRARANHSIRWTQDVIIFIPRKAGKTTLSSMIALYELQFGEAGPEVFCLAVDGGQAKILFDSAYGMVGEITNKALRNAYKRTQFEIKKAGVHSSTFKALSKDTKKTGDGKNPSCVIVDEAAQIVDRAGIEVLHSGMGARVNPLRIYITTASATRETKFYEDMKHFEAVLAGQADDDGSWFGIMFGIDEGDDINDPLIWRKVNPMHGITVQDANIRKAVKEARDKPASMNELKRKQFNIYTGSNSAWLDLEHWEKGQKDPRPVEEIESSFIGFDLGATSDMNSITTLHRYRDGKFRSKTHFFIPMNSLENVPTHYRPIYEAAIERGTLVLTPGNARDDDFLIEYLKEEAFSLPNLSMIGYDPHNASNIVAKLEEEGLPVLKVGQGATALSDSTKLTEIALLRGDIEHEGDPMMSWQFGNAELESYSNGNIKVTKNSGDSAAKIDGVISIIIAMHCAATTPVSSSDDFTFI